ncbi:hypothetical protein [Desulforamulus ruminis]|uniref:Uncharacterized protein n=1 Tax=Desulforamulus ruminis (strain ATCC 23193 / DSM 2154 / NCIMB 8452 / DL) TaxID=696281 RepID=F6DL93_DESRL|nr:hypothetical protein [Desulforamulus ruminis]AEG59314.1 hypothetical protein Desru_1039 [Desulforamulus ruminis DSM 2154]
MINRDTFWNRTEYDYEQDFTALIEAGQRTIDWSLKIYFKNMKKSMPLFIEKLLKEEKFDFNKGFASFFLHKTEVAELVKDLEEHINLDIISLQNKWLPHIKLTSPDLNISFDFFTEILKEQRRTVQLCKQVEKTMHRLTFKTLSGVTSSFMPKGSLINPLLVNKVTAAMALDTAKSSGDLLQSILAGSLDNLEHDWKEQFKYQLADQLYHWFDRYIAEQKNLEQVVNQ